MGAHSSKDFPIKKEIIWGYGVLAAMNVIVWVAGVIVHV